MTRDDELAVAFQEKGDRGAFWELYDRVAPALWRRIRRRVGTRADADDVLQETFLSYLGSPTFDPAKGGFWAFILTAAKRRCIDLKRKESRSPPIHAGISAERHGEKVGHEHITGPMVDRLLSALRPEYRQVLRLTMTTDMTDEQIGDVLRHPVNTIRTFRKRALEELRNLVEHEDDDGEL